MKYTNLFSLIALIISAIALSWNIIRDLVLDRVQIRLKILFGDMAKTSSGATGIFAQAGSLTDVEFKNPHVYIEIVNFGRRNVVVNGIEILQKDKSTGSMITEGLPLKIEPYDVFKTTRSISNEYPFLKLILEDKIKKIWVSDTKNKKWTMSKKDLLNLKKTAMKLTEGMNSIDVVS